MFDEISSVLGVECIETDSDLDMDNMGLGLSKINSGETYDVVTLDVEDDDDEINEPSPDELESIEVRKKVLKNMDKLVDSAMSVLPHVIKEIKFTDDNKVFTTAANYISMIAKLNEQYLTMVTVNEPEIKETKKGEKGDTQSTVTNNIIMTNANDIFDRINK